MDIRTPEELAKRVNQQLHLGFSARPWNVHAPGDTLWWLVPSTEWPAHRHAKYVFSLAKDDPRKYLVKSGEVLRDDAIFAGFAVEKGFGTEAAAVNRRLAKRLTAIVDDTWAWGRVVHGPGPAQLVAVVAPSPGTLVVAVVAYPVHDPEDPEKPSPDVLIFSSAQGALSLVARNGLPVAALTEASRAESLEALLSALGSVGGFFWVDLHIGAYVRPGAVDVHRLYADVLSPFAHWLE